MCLCTEDASSQCTRLPPLRLAGCTTRWRCREAEAAAEEEQLEALRKEKKKKKKTRRAAEEQQQQQRPAAQREKEKKKKRGRYGSEEPAVPAAPAAAPAEGMLPAAMPPGCGPWWALNHLVPHLESRRVCSMNQVRPGGCQGPGVHEGTLLLLLSSPLPARVQRPSHPSLPALSADQCFRPLLCQYPRRGAARPVQHAGGLPALRPRLWRRSLGEGLRPQVEWAGLGVDRPAGPASALRHSHCQVIFARCQQQRGQEQEDRRRTAAALTPSAVPPSPPPRGSLAAAAPCPPSQTC